MNLLQFSREIGAVLLDQVGVPVNQTTLVTLQRNAGVLRPHGIRQLSAQLTEAASLQFLQDRGREFMRATPEVTRVRQIIRTHQPLANVSLALGVPRTHQDGLDTVALTTEGAEVTRLLLTLDNERVAREHEAALAKAAAKAAKAEAKKLKEIEVARTILADWFPEAVAASNQSNQHLGDLKVAAAAIVASATTKGRTVTVPVSDEIADLLYTFVV